MQLDRRALLRAIAGSTALSGLSGLSGLSAPPWLGEGHRPARAALPRMTGFAPLAAGDARSEPRAAPRPFSMVGVRAPAGAEVELRVSPDGVDFGPWIATSPLHVEREGPDGDEADRAGNAWKRMSTPVWTSPASWLQLRVDGARLEDVEVALVGPRPRVEDAGIVSHGGVTRPTPAPWRADRDEPDLTLPVSGGVRIVTREEWGADESIRRGGPSYADRVLHGVVHHTAGGNSYAAADGPRIVRGIYEYHVRDNGWNDIGYNLLVDRYGVVYEGRYGGLDLPVIGAHAVGANAGSFGIALLGDFQLHEVGWPEPRETLFEVLLWKFGLHAIEPSASVSAAGRDDVPTLAGHRDVGSTTCPGDRLHALLPEWRRGLAERLPGEPTDIAGHAHEENIRSLRAAGITTGYPDGTYRPDVGVTRAQMATFLRRAGQLEPGGDPGFRDVTPSHPHHDGIAAVAAAGIAEGHGDGTFRPEQEVTRGQMASFLARALGLDGRPGTTYRDVPPTHPHNESVEAVAEQGIALGYDDGTFRPEQRVTRGQMASFLVRGFELPPAGDGPDDPEDLEDPDDPDDADDLDEADDPDEIEDPDEHQPEDRQAAAGPSGTARRA
jgi:hypothetical protein